MGKLLRLKLPHILMHHSTWFHNKLNHIHNHAANDGPPKNEDGVELDAEESDLSTTYTNNVKSSNGMDHNVKQITPSVTTTSTSTSTTTTNTSTTNSSFLTLPITSTNQANHTNNSHSPPNQCYMIHRTTSHDPPRPSNSRDSYLDVRELKMRLEALSLEGDGTRAKKYLHPSPCSTIALPSPTTCHHPRERGPKFELWIDHAPRSHGDLSPPTTCGDPFYEDNILLKEGNHNPNHHINGTTTTMTTTNNIYNNDEGMMGTSSVRRSVSSSNSSSINAYSNFWDRDFSNSITTSEDNCGNQICMEGKPMARMRKCKSLNIRGIDNSNQYTFCDTRPPTNYNLFKLLRSRAKQKHGRDSMKYNSDVDLSTTSDCPYNNSCNTSLPYSNVNHSRNGQYSSSTSKTSNSRLKQTSSSLLDQYSCLPLDNTRSSDVISNNHHINSCQTSSLARPCAKSSSSSSSSSYSNHSSLEPISLKMKTSLHDFKEIYKDRNHHDIGLHDDHDNENLAHHRRLSSSFTSNLEYINHNTKQKMYESLVMVKSSYDPSQDFKESMREMIVTKKLHRMVDLVELLQCYMGLNSDQYHHTIVKVFNEVWCELFG